MSDFSRASTFYFREHGYDPHSGVATLVYGFERGAPLTETLVFPHAPWPRDPARQAAFLRALSLLHLLAGVSYYKAALPPSIVPGAQVPDRRLARFLEETWSGGLAEFAFRNEIPLEGHIHFPHGMSGQASSATDRADDLSIPETAVEEEAAARAMPLAEPLELPARALVAMGGGKDSLVSLEALREAGIEIQPITIGASSLIGDTVRAARLPLLRIERRLDPRLMEMNAAGAWNGHVPVTAINMAILSCAALLYGYRWVVFSNERSSEQATLIDSAGRPVNHQYSKSFAHEQRFQNVVHERVAPDLEVFSLLRPLSEAAVTKRFARLREYHPVFSSCNRNFHSDGSRISGRWCGDCPKCRFTTLALAPWLSPEAITAIMGANLLNDPQQEAGFRALCALGMDKPFECVGTAEESRALLAKLGELEAWRGMAVVRQLLPELKVGPGALTELLTPAGPHAIPDEIARRVDF